MAVQHKYLFYLFCITGLALSSFQSHAETVPIPQKRPAVMNASPAYIKQLMAKQNIDIKESVLYESDLPEAIPEPEQKPEVEETDVESREDEALSSLKNMDQNDILAAISDNNKISKGKSAVPVPSHKPSRLRKPIPEIQKEVIASSDNNETALVTFMLQKNQIDLDLGLETFLTEHAIPLFKKNNDLKMEIQAYASLNNGEQDGDMRLALARALEVRSFLIKHDISPSRLKLSPIGQDIDNQSDDRIDLLFIENE